MNYFLPHHGVYRPEKSTTKLRVVFNASSPTDNGLFLNDIQYNGGVIQDDLYAQMIRFRTYRYALTRGIKKFGVIPSDSYTKRTVLSTIAILFDHLRLVEPVVSKAKMFMQKLWRLSIDWKDPLPNKVYYKWLQLIIRLESPNIINIEKRVVIENPSSIDIHGFSDASERCYGAAVYCKSKK
ncbi:uncharacterized protein TNCV_2335311 [Trichonephila clavipes]|uniref:Uncharacterized protein n=1 Tax=Trichonephila clavipes TaxID=2585209 RepID=A0A8X6VCG9_TRICX|nr:uncharacterized protein TNCV_2335311 [Trichonephila clavipes]